MQRDEARQEACQASMAVLREKELNEVAQNSSQHEIYRLRTTTEQQGKLIRHMCSLLPPEHRPFRNPLDGNYGQLPDRLSVQQGGKGDGTRRRGRALKLGAPMISVASAFFRRAGDSDKTE